MYSRLLARAETNRVTALSGLDAGTQDSLGQFFTPVRAAMLIASMPRLPAEGRLTVLDPGAGSGMLSAALIARVLDERPELSTHVVAVECDDTVLTQLHDTLDACKTAGDGKVTTEVIEADYIIASTGLALDERLMGFDLVIQNPPYGKLPASSAARVAVREAGTDAPNLYAAFLALGTAALQPGGQLVAITPRSFCNGPYFGPFRRNLVDQIALDRVHVFKSRSTVFSDTGVLQENVIISGTKAGQRDKVLLSISSGHEDEIAQRHVAYTDVVRPEDPHRFIRIATGADDTAVAELILVMPNTLASLDIAISTGRVVDFRSRECLLHDSTDGAAPLVYPANLREGSVVWPLSIKKAQWFHPKTEKDTNMLVPEGWYCVVKRFSAKEERRRIVAAVWSPERTAGPIAFENHVNIFHAQRVGLDRDTAYGLSLWLNSSVVDRYFRTFSGHTQVNATDLRAMRYPDAKSLRQLGKAAPERLPDQAEIDELVDTIIGATGEAA